MKLTANVVFLGILILVQSCTGQNPAGIKTPITNRIPIKESCSHMAFEGQVLSQKNMLNIMDCTGWAKLYPETVKALQSMDGGKLDSILEPLNNSFFATKAQRKSFFEIVTRSQNEGAMDELGILLEKSLSEHDLLGQLNRALNSEKLDAKESSALLKVFSQDNNQNLEFVRALKNITRLYETKKTEIDSILSPEDKVKLVDKAMVLLNDITQQMNAPAWKNLSNVVYESESPLKQWAVESKDQDLGVLLGIIKEPGMYENIRFLKKSIDENVTCKNKASTKDFSISIGIELEHKIESLKHDPLKKFEQILLHGLVKYIAFQGFCEEEAEKQGLNAFHSVLNYAFTAISSSHDYHFIKNIHLAFGEDRYAFLSFLSSKSFFEVRKLILDLDEKGEDEHFVRVLYDIVAEMSSEDLRVLADLVRDLSVDKSKSRQWYLSASSLWKTLEVEEKKELVDLLGLTLSAELKTSRALQFAEDVLVGFPEFSTLFSNKLLEENFQDSMKYVTLELSRPEIQKELSQFFSHKGLFEIVDILTQDTEKKQSRSEVARASMELQTVTYVAERTADTEALQTRSCFHKVSDEYAKSSSYYSIVNTLPEDCLAVLGDVGFVGQIYIWMNASNQFFKEHYQVGDFHSATGVWAPGMLQFIFSAAVKADLAIRAEHGPVGIKANLNEIHRVVTDPELLEVFHLFSKVYAPLNANLKLDQRLLPFFESKNDQELNVFIGDTLGLMKKNAPYIVLAPKQASCKELSSAFGTNPCLTEAQLTDGLVELLRLAKRKNEDGKSLAQELVRWLHPKGGIALPFGAQTTSVHQTSIEEIIRFLNDLSSEKTLDTFYYLDDTGSKELKGTTIDRLEVVIRDINFLNNFYGAYFMNEIAMAQNYRQKVISSEKLLKILDGTSRILGLPRSSEPKLKNVKSTFWSLVEISDDYVQADGQTKSYAPFIQSFLASVDETSKLSTQKVKAFRKPKGYKVEGHNGLFVTKITELSGFRHASQFVVSRFGRELKVLETDEFKKINQNLIGRHNMEDIQAAFQRILDKYLDQDQNQLNLITADVVKFFMGLSSNEQKIIEEILVKGSVLLSDEKVSTGNLSELAGVIELVIETWPDIKVILGQVKNREGLLSQVNKILDTLVKDPEALNRIISVLLDSKLLKFDDLRSLVKDQKFVPELVALLNFVVDMKGVDSDINWNETIKGIFAQDDTQWEPLKAWFKVALGVEKDKLTVSLLVEFLGEKTADGYRMKFVMDEFFVNHREKLLQFLDSSFKSLSLKSE